MMDQMDDGDFPQLQVITEFLRTEAENRVVQTTELQLYQCISNCIQDITDRTPGHTFNNTCGENCVSHLTNSNYLKNTVVELLERHSEQFQPVSDMLVDNVHIQDSDTNKKQVYEMIIADCKSGSNYQVYIKLLLYAIATCTNTPIYILDTNETGLHWVYYQPLFSYEEQTGRCIRFITMYMSPVRTFYPIYQHDIEDKRKPKAEGQIGMYLSILKDIQVLEIDVPSTLLNVPNSFISEICSKCNREVIKQCCEIFRSLDVIDEETFTCMATAYRARSKYLNMLQGIAEQNELAFKIICQVLIHRQEKKVLSPYVEDWDSFVSECSYLKQFKALEALDNAVYNRNVVVTAFVSSCHLGGREMDERRKKVTTTVIASSSAGIVSGGLVVAGIILAPTTFGVSLALSIAGGAIGMASGVAAGTARAIEAVKENKKLGQIKTLQNNMQATETAVAKALRDVELVFETIKRKKRDVEDGDFGKNKRGFLAVGSVFRATHGGVGIGLVATRLAASTTAVSAAILGPLSLVLDIAFLAEAVHNKANGDKTNSSKILQTAAEIIETKSKIFNSMLRGNCDEEQRMFDRN